MYSHIHMVIVVIYTHTHTLIIGVTRCTFFPHIFSHWTTSSLHRIRLLFYC